MALLTAACAQSPEPTKTDSIHTQPTLGAAAPLPAASQPTTQVDEATQKLKLLRQKAESGDVHAQFELGQLCEKVEPKQLEEAVKWYRLAAEHGYAPAQDSLGNMYLTAEGGLPKNVDLALKWFRKAAEQGNAQSELDIGEVYLAELDTPNYREAIKWYQKACNRHFPEAYVALGQLYAQGIGIAKNQKKAAELYRQGAQLGDALGQFLLAEDYFRGIGIPKDRSEAARWYQKSAEQNDFASEAMLGRLYEHGWGVSQDRNQAVTWYTRAAAHGSDLAQKRLKAMKQGSDEDPFESIDKFCSEDAVEKQGVDPEQLDKDINKRLSQFADSYRIAQLVGQQVELAIPSGNLKTMWGGRTYVSDADFFGAMVNKDKAGKQTLLNSDQVVMLAPHTKALLVQFNKETETAFVHISSGNHIGENLFVEYNFIKPLNSN
jgi:hypothetical protein